MGNWFLNSHTRERSDMDKGLVELTASEVVEGLKKGEISPLELISVAETRILETEPAINALPTLCFERARVQAKALMEQERHGAENSRGWLAGLPVAIKDLTDVAGVRTTYGSTIFRDHIPKTSHPLVKRIENRNYFNRRSRYKGNLERGYY